MKKISSLLRYLDKLESPKQIALVFWVLLIDAATFQILWPWLIWIFGSHPEAMWGIIAPPYENATDWFFHYFFWLVTIGIFSLWALPDNRQMSFFRWFALWLLIWGSQKLLGMIALGYFVTIGIFNDGCPTYQMMGEDDYGNSTECTQRGVGVSE